MQALSPSPVHHFNYRTVPPRVPSKTNPSACFSVSSCFPRMRLCGLALLAFEAAEVFTVGLPFTLKGVEKDPGLCPRIDNAGITCTRTP